MFSPKGMDYKRSMTIFSPIGRLNQIEYNLETTSKGSKTLGLNFSFGIAHVSDSQTLVSFEKFYLQLDLSSDSISQNNNSLYLNNFDLILIKLAEKIIKRYSIFNIKTIFKSISSSDQ